MSLLSCVSSFRTAVVLVFYALAAWPMNAANYVWFQVELQIEPDCFCELP